MKLNKIIAGSVLLILGIIIGSFGMMHVIGSHRMNHENQSMSQMNQMNINTNDEQSPLMSNKPSMPGQEAFGTIQEIMKILENDKNTDWSKVNIPALRQHLIDMNELTMNAKVKYIKITGGLDMIITGEGRTIGAVQRMVTTHTKMTLSKIKQWHVSSKKLENGMELTATADNQKEIDKIRGLGFIGIMATGANHPLHHLMIAKGEMHTNN